MIIKLRKALKEPSPETTRTRVYKEGYSTKNELDFIKGLGTFAPHNKALFDGPNYEKHLLENYIAGAHHRELWGRINKDEVIRFAEARLEHL